MAAAGAGPREQGLRIGCLNTNCMTHKMADIERLIVDNEFDVFVVIETCLGNERDDKIKIENYSCVSYPGDFGARVRGGIAIYFSDQIKYKNKGEFEDEDTDIHFVRIRITQPVKLDLVAVYNPSRAHTAALYLKLKGFLDGMNPKDKNVMVLGDFNIDLDPNKNAIDSMNHKALLEDYKLTELIKKPTHVKEGRYATYIDHIYFTVRDRLPVAEADVIETNISDHYPIYCTLTIQF